MLSARWIASTIIATGIVLGGVGTATADSIITIGTGDVTGVYYPVGGAICRMVNIEREAHGIHCSIELTDGSVDNLNTIRAGKLDMGVAQSDWQLHAYNGTNKFKNAGQNKDLRAVFSVHTEPLTNVTRSDFGDPDSGQRATVVSSTKVSLETIYQVVKAVFENFDEFRNLHPAFTNLKKEEMIKEGLSAPLHDGAKKYYKEAGLM